MKFLSNRKQRMVAAAAIAVIVVVGAGALVVGGGGNDNGVAPRAGIRPTATPVVGLDVAPTAGPTELAAVEEPTPSPEPNRADCNAIRGTDYASETERLWFRDNCSGVASASSGGGGSGGGGTASTSRASFGDRLIIPSIGVNAGITPSRVPASGSMPTPPGYYDVYWYDFSSFPGVGGYVDGGNVVLAGHVTCAYCNNGGRGRVVFGGVPSLSAGATIQYRTASGQVFDYVVTGAVDVYPGSANWESLLAAGRADLTLITCNGILDTEILEYDQRRVVYARKV